MEPKGFMGYREHVNWVVMSMSNTPPVARTKIIEPMVFIDYLNKVFFFLLDFGMAMQYPFRFQWICDGTQTIFDIP
jgi:hypothetical protein